MARQVEQQVEYYYDSHPTAEDLMGETAVHRALISYLALVLRWLFHGQRCAIYENLNFFHTFAEEEYPLAPDIAVLKGETFELVRSWKVWQSGVAPQVVFEIASEETWHKDLNVKPMKYAQMGVEEYFAYDPNKPILRSKNPRRLYGWQLDKARGVMRPMPIGPDGRLWSNHVESFLVPDEAYLRLYDSKWQLRLTKDEAEARRAEAATMRAEETRRRAEVLAEKLRSLGIDPDQL